MVAWRFGDYAEDGEAWLKHPTQLFAYVDCQTPHATRGSEWRRFMVVTRSWVEGHLNALKHGVDGRRALWLALPTMLVLPDAEGEVLRAMVNDVVQQGVSDVYSTPPVNLSPPPIG